jgi:hypothetical protein
MTCNAAAYRSSYRTCTSRLDGISGLHIFVMTQYLNMGGNPLSLNLTPGYILVFKSAFFDLAKESYNADTESYLDLCNENDDIILRMTFRAGEKKIFCNDRASKSIGDGWGKERSTDLGPLYMEKMKWQSVAISLRNFWTESRIPRYQILLDLNTVCYFDSRFPGPVTQMRYSTYRKSGGKSPLSEQIKVACFKFSDLQPEELRAIESR